MWNIYVSLCSLSWPGKNSVQSGKYRIIWYFYYFPSDLCYCFFVFQRWECSWLRWGSWLISMCAAWILCGRSWKQEWKNTSRLHNPCKIKTIVVHGVSLPNIFTALNNSACCFYVLAFLPVKFSAREFSSWPEVGKRRLTWRVEW